MKLELLVPKVFEHTRLRMQGMERDKIHESVKLGPRESILNYSGTDLSYYIDYAIGDEERNIIGLECMINSTSFSCVEYTEKNRPVLKFDIEELPSVVGEDEFFQMTLVNDYDNLTHSQLNDILTIRDIIRSKKVNWGNFE